MIKDVSDAVSERIKAPLYGYVILAFVAINWKGFFFLIMTTGAPEIRWAAFESHTSIWELYFWPVVVGVLLTLTSPWTRFAFDWVSSTPLAKSRHMAFEDEDKDIEKKLELEELRDRKRKIKERALVDKAKIDHEIENSDLSDDEKSKLNFEIQEIRNDSDIKIYDEKYTYYQTVKDLRLRNIDFQYMAIILAGPLIFNRGSNYFKNKLIGTLEIGEKPDYFDEFDPNSLLDLCYRFKDEGLLDKKDVSESVSIYEINNSGRNFINYIHNLSESDYLEFEVILKNNEENYRK